MRTLSPVLHTTLRLAEHWTHALDATLHAAGFDPPVVAPTTRVAVAHEGSSTLYRMRPVLRDRSEESLAPLVVVPSLINRWWVFDLCEGSSVLAAMASRGRPVFVLDWGLFADGDRRLDWADLHERIARLRAVVQRTTGARRVHLAGFSIGGTLSLTHAALEPDAVASYTLIAGPVDFTRAGAIARALDVRRFDPRWMTAAGNVPPWAVLSGFAAIQPRVFAHETLAAQRALWLERPKSREGRRARHLRLALTRWLYDGVPFPARAYETVTRALYQRNELWRGVLRVRDRVVDLTALGPVPALVVTAREDVLCPAEAALALREVPSGAARDALSLSGSHVTSLVGPQAEEELYGPWRAWLASHEARAR